MFIAALITVALAQAATTPPQDCLKIGDELDRKYCLDKGLQSTRNQLETEKKTWSKGLTGDAKNARTSSLQTNVAAKKEYIAFLQSEIALEEKHLEALNAVTVTKAAAPKKEKKKEKKDKKGGFRIKL